MDNLNFVRKGADATTGNFVSKKIELRNSKTALGGVNNDAKQLEMCEDLSEVVKLLYRVSAGNEDVVHKQNPGHGEYDPRIAGTSGRLYGGQMASG